MWSYESHGTDDHCLCSRFERELDPARKGSWATVPTIGEDQGGICQCGCEGRQGGTAGSGRYRSQAAGYEYVPNKLTWDNADDLGDVQLVEEMQQMQWKH